LIEISPNAELIQNVEQNFSDFIEALLHRRQ
jgi:hypothetical protein